MAMCNDCIHRTVCVILAFPDAFENTKWDKEPCDHFKAADIAPRAEVAREIFEEIERLMLDGEIGGKYPAKVINPDKYAALKKKYTEETP